MRVFVTGAGGFVGQRLVQRLREAGHVPVGCDEEHDVTSHTVLGAVFDREQPDAVIHLAALSSVAASFEQAELAFRVNYLGARTLLDTQAQHAPEARVLLIGSGDVYGSAPEGAPPWQESDPVSPRSPYARSKAAAELLGTLAAERGQSIVRVRPFNHTGRGQRADFVVSSFAKQIAEIEHGSQAPAMRVGNLASSRDFLDIEDVIAAYLALLSPDVPCQVYNVARGAGVAIQAVLDELLAMSGLDVRVEVDPERFRPTDTLAGDAGRLRRVTGWRPTRDWRDTLADVLDDWRERVRAA